MNFVDKFDLKTAWVNSIILEMQYKFSLLVTTKKFSKPVV